MLSIKDLQVSVEDKAILRGLDLDVRPGEVHAIMGRTVPGRVRFPRRWRAVKIMKWLAALSNLKAKIYWNCRQRIGRAKASLWRSSIR
ncbi:cysteine desulfurase ATPase component [Citrobacter koseri]|nr:cysteine desulfurase ATPase component [Citrobacter koseri]